VSALRSWALSPGSERRHVAEQSLEELAGLADAAGADIALRVSQERPRPDPATFVGKGKLDLIALACDEAHVDVVIFDNELAPAQLRNIEARVKRKVLDRTQLILDIFARRARTRKGSGRSSWRSSSTCSRGSSARAWRSPGWAAASAREGPGETKLETDRRKIRVRIHQIKKEIDEIRRRRAQLRERRHKQSVPTVALVGYTNAGKTTLFNLLTREAPRPRTRCS
jgi:GTP-binding protein HflX